MPGSDPRLSGPPRSPPSRRQATRIGGHRSSPESGEMVPPGGVGSSARTHPKRRVSDRLGRGGSGRGYAAAASARQALKPNTRHGLDRELPWFSHGHLRASAGECSKMRAGTRTPRSRYFESPALSPRQPRARRCCSLARLHGAAVERKAMTTEASRGGSPSTHRAAGGGGWPLSRRPCRRGRSWLARGRRAVARDPARGWRRARSRSASCVRSLQRYPLSCDYGGRGFHGSPFCKGERCGFRDAPFG
jgi:hypothetical protein